MDGRWYGASYGWEWPHGFYNIAMAALLAGVSCFQLTGDQKYLELPRNQMRQVMELGRVEALDLSKMSLAEHWTPQLSAMAGRTIAESGETNRRHGGAEASKAFSDAASAAGDVLTPTFVVPYRHADSGIIPTSLQLWPSFPLLTIAVQGGLTSSPWQQCIR
eukprot:COSAG05_NODE_28_length_29121_cov_56.951933_3_plen_162_part_00